MRNVKKALVLDHFGASERFIRIPYKPVEFCSFWSPKRKMAPKMIKKALGFSVKVEGVLRLCKMSKSIGPRAFGASKKVDQNTL